MNQRLSALKTNRTLAQQGIAMLVASQLVVGTLPAYAAAPGSNDGKTASPIKHVIIIIGENRSFDHVFATYRPRNPFEYVSNLLSKGVIKADGTKGPNYKLSAQYNPVDSTNFQLNPTTGKTVYPNIPPPEAGGNEFASDTTPAPFLTLSAAEATNPYLEVSYEPFLTTGATGLASGAVDTRVHNVNTLGEGVFQLTPGVAYDDYAASPVHRFYQMWQQLDCDAKKATRFNPSGCQADLFPWVETTVGQGTNGAKLPTNLNTGEGSAAMAFYNMQQGDVPYFKYLADNYTINDNFHQSVMGGTGANHIMFGFGDAIWYSDGNGHAAAPPVNQIENPNPQPGSNNWYDQDGYSGGSYSACADLSQPGVAPVVNYLEALPRPIEARCEATHYYLLNNYNPGYIGTGQTVAQAAAAYVATFPPAEQPIVAAQLAGTVSFTIPPSNVPHIGDVLSKANISYTYFGEGWNSYQTDPLEQSLNDKYCTICNPFQYATDIMTDPAQRAAHIADTDALSTDIASNKLPAVSIVKPNGYLDGHPGSSKLDLFEGFCKKIIDQVQANPEVWKDTAIFITFDEGGGYYDSGYVQPVDFFGDGTRIPLIVVSPYSFGGHINHTYSDHVSLDKFIERNWHLPTITKRSRDNFPNPDHRFDPYVPANTPALGDLFDVFNFSPFSFSPFNFSPFHF
jgi:phospholipase C